MNGNSRMVLTCLTLLLASIALEGYTQLPVADFKDWKGTRYSFQVSDPSDSLSSPTLTELRGENGLPLWFEREMYKVVCLTGECRMVHIWLYWDGAGNYLGYRTAENEPLTKTDHHEFSADDHKKLHSILSDTVSVLKSLKQEDLIILPEKKGSKTIPDAYTGATRQSLQEYMVKNAAYTCYTLWHTVYGITREQIFSLLNARCDDSYLQRIFTSPIPSYLVWGIRRVTSHPDNRKKYEGTILHLIESENSEIAHHALAYFTSKDWEESAIQLKMAEAVGRSLSQIKFEIIWKFSKLQRVHNEALLVLLDQYDKKRIYAGLVGYLCEMIHHDQLEDDKIVKSLKKLAHDKNPYVKDLAKNLLKSR